MTGPMIVDLTGEKYGRLTLLEPVKNPNPKRRGAFWRCLCDCGNEHFAYAAAMRQGNVTSCGCQKSEATKKRLTTHGKTNSELYKIWKQMRSRCRRHHRYAGRGIEVCERWSSFENFEADMGPRPSKHHSMDRIDNDKGYSPENCRWATMRTQQRNRADNPSFEGVPLVDWADRLGVTVQTIRQRVKLYGSVHIPPRHD